jgi:peptide/nickel transport system substrate-binding protein
MSQVSKSVPRRRRQWAVVSAAAVVALALSACSGSASSAPSTPTGPQTFSIAYDSMTSTLDPITFDNGAHRTALDPVKAGLVHFKTIADNGDKLTGPSDVEPYLATAYTEDATGINFTLGDYKSAAGNTLSPDDVKYTFERLIATKDSIGAFLGKQGGLDVTNPVTITGANTVHVNLTVNPLSLFFFDYYNFMILDSTAVKAHATADDPWSLTWLTTNTATYGPYQATSFVPGQSVNYDANPNWTISPLAYAKLNIQAVPDAAARIVLVKTGKANMTASLPLDAMKPLATDNSVKVVVVPSQTQDVLELTKTFAPFQDERVRQAISLALDRPALVAGPYSTFGKPSTSVITSAVPGKNSTSEYYQKNTDKAKALLAAAGQSNLTFTITSNGSTSSSVPNDALLSALKTQLAVVGINVNVATVPAAADYLAAFHEQKYEAWIRIEGPAAIDAVFDLNLYHDSTGVSNWQKDADPVLDSAVTAAFNLSGDARDTAIAPGIESFNNLMTNIPLVEITNQYVYSKNTCPATPTLSVPISPIGATPC